MFEELVPIVNVCEDGFYIRLGEWNYDLEMNQGKYSIISNDLDHIPVALYGIEFDKGINFHDIRIKALYSMNKINWNAALGKISDLIYQYEDNEEEVTMNDLVNETNEDRTSKILEDAGIPTYSSEGESDVVSIKENYVGGIRFYTSTELTRLGINYNTLQGDKYVKIFGNKYIIVKDIVDKFLLNNGIENGNKEKE